MENRNRGSIPRIEFFDVMRILIVEDDRELSDLLVFHLQNAGFEAQVAGSGSAALKALDRSHFDLLILDLMLPEGPDGLELCQRVRVRSPYTPILMVTARADEVDRVLGLELGADDYVTKPFSLRELIARVRALLRRIHALQARAEPDAIEAAVEFEGLSIEPASRRVEVRGSVVDLTPREFDLLLHFARNPGRVFSRAALLDQVWGYSHQGYEHTVNSHINRLRTKIERDPGSPEVILTVWGVGYRFQPGARNA